eukprot:13930064-Heterocapsa_arctica.AAC.1
MNPIIALIPKDRAENEGQLRPITILPYIYRIWMAVRKRRVKHWAMQLDTEGSAHLKHWFGRLLPEEN